MELFSIKIRCTFQLVSTKDEDEKRRQKAEYDPTPKISGGVKTTI